MDINRLRYFVVTAELGSLRRASERLFVSSAALSKAIKHLEEELATQLIAPSGRGVAITDRGRWLARRGRVLLDAADGLEREFLGNSRMQRTLRIGSFEAFTTYFMGAMMQEHLSDTELLLQQLLPGELEQALTDNVIDLAITYTPVAHPDLHAVPVVQLSMGVFGRADVWASEAFSQLPFVVPAFPIRGVPHHLQGLDGWPDNQLPRKIRYRVMSMEGALDLCRRGLAVAHLPHFIVRLHNQQVVPEQALAQVPGVPRKYKRLSRATQVHLMKRKTDTECPFFDTVAYALAQLESRH